MVEQRRVALKQAKGDAAYEMAYVIELGEQCKCLRPGSFAYDCAKLRMNAAYRRFHAYMDDVRRLLCRTTVSGAARFELNST